MSREKELIKNTAIISLGTFFPKFFTVLITPILTAQLTKNEYGKYDLVVTIVSLLLPIASLQISSSAFRFLINKRNKKEECGVIISTIYAFVFVTAIIAGIAYFIVIGRFSGLSGIVVSLYFVFDILLITSQQMLRGLGKNLFYSVSTIIQSLVLLIFIVLLTGVLGSKNMGLLGVAVSLMLSTAIPFLAVLFTSEIVRYFKIELISIKVLREMVAYSWPMVPNNLSIWVLNLSDRLIITAVLGIEANAVYAVANKLPTIFSSFQNTFAMAWQESASLASEDDDKEQYYSDMCDWVYRLLTGLMAGLIMCTPVIWKILIKGDYHEAYYQLPVLYLGILFSCMSATIGGIYIAHMKTKSVGLTTMVAATINLIIDLCLIRSIGIWAGSFSTLISYFLLWLYRAIDVQKFQKVKINKRTVELSIILLSLMAIINYQNKLIFNIINIPMCVLVLVLFDRDIIKIMIWKIRRKILTSYRD